MADDDKIIIGIQLDDGTIKKSFSNIEEQAKKTGSNIGETIEQNSASGIKNVGSSLSKSFKLAAAAAATYFSVGAIKGIFSSMISEAKNQENAIFGLNNSLRLTGQYSAEASKEIQDYASNLQNVSKYGDDAILSTASFIQTLGNLSKNELKRATQATLDLSSALNIDLNTASQAVGKAAAGQIGALSRYIGTIDPAIVKSKDFGAVLGELEKKFGGSALAALNTYEGATKRMSNAFGDILESFGLGITTSPVVVGFINKITDSFTKMAPSVDDVRGYVNSLIMSSLQMAKVFSEYVLPVLEQAYNVVKSLGVGIGAFASAVASISSGEFATAFQTMKSAASDIFSTDGGVLFDFKSSLSMTETIDNLILDAQRLSESVPAPIENMATRVSNSLNKISDVSKQLGATFKNAVVSGIAGGVQNIVSNIMKGEGAFKNFGKLIMNVFGDMATNMGMVLIGAGIGIESLKALGGTAAIAAGIGLVALGQVLKSLSGGAGSEPSTEGATGGGYSSGLAGSDVTARDELADNEPRTMVNLRVDGNILSTEESALHIVELLNSAFDQKGVTVRTA